MENLDHTLRRPRTGVEWTAYHEIRRKVLFENRGDVEYVENHPDEFEQNHYPMILVENNMTIGVIRIDIDDHIAWFRRVAIREDLQRCGHGRCLLRLAESFARDQGCDEVRSNVAADAVEFYERCGYSRDVVGNEFESVPMRKELT
ncbi:MAG: GNAT family N-acetyltransferase [Blastocatellia bacterium]|nr:MAG: GNAT family N-acetyltransferase [Blastocatellia bacterium]